MRRNSIKVGQRYKSRSCGDFVVIEVYSYKKVKVRFVNTGYETIVQGGQVTDGRISDKLSPTVYGVGVLGVIDFPVEGVKSYKIWSTMIQRCYSEKAQSRVRNRKYKDCTVCDEWKTYTNFKVWFDKHYIEGYELDKDLTVLGNKVYSPKACIFIPHRINSLLNDSGLSRGKYPIGVHRDTESGKFSAQITEDGKRKFLGYHDTPEDAYNTYLINRKKIITKEATYALGKGQISPVIFNNIINYKIE